MNAKPTTKLTSRQEKAILALINEPTMQRAAVVAGVTDRTLRRWMSEPLFRLAFRRARRESFQHAMSMAQKYAPVALNTLAVISSDRGAPSAARVSASRAVLDFGRESLELDDLLEEVEQRELFAAPAMPAMKPPREAGHCGDVGHARDVGPCGGGGPEGPAGRTEPTAANGANLGPPVANGHATGAADGRDATDGGGDQPDGSSPRRRVRLGLLVPPAPPSVRRRHSRRDVASRPEDFLFNNFLDLPP